MIDCNMDLHVTSGPGTYQQSCLGGAMIIHGLHCVACIACSHGCLPWPQRNRCMMQAVFPTYNRDTQLYGHATMRAQWSDSGRIEASIVLEVRLAGFALKVFCAKSEAC
eukprot:1160361-Pelagomonas_calceolata.AAC.3